MVGSVHFDTGQIGGFAMDPANDDAREEGHALLQSQRKRWSPPRVIVSEELGSSEHSPTPGVKPTPFTPDQYAGNGTGFGGS